MVDQSFCSRRARAPDLIQSQNYAARKVLHVALACISVTRALELVVGKTYSFILSHWSSQGWYPTLPGQVPQQYNLPFSYFGLSICSSYLPGMEKEKFNVTQKTQFFVYLPKENHHLLLTMAAVAQCSVASTVFTDLPKVLDFYSLGFLVYKTSCRVSLG